MVGKFGNNVVFGALSMDGRITLESILSVYEEVARAKLSEDMQWNFKGNYKIFVSQRLRLP